ncbi:dipeptide/oligopeptide/nickel ABC transporter permease/ATP-binding protein [Halalkalibacterium ligniniphilum]|uniref:dipeptide/oligopeptide/nickel ABC transporter permease/ATP-binding protein n=1 Tax=Halalkalibacterium ligniniphilum TaxID=1134413 RepID=UPI00034D926F|nr:dipeptide/oligopeptide/nickel ABC transporter permease/ATP-binding protein [Halalkalibacterium ligniniphilum]
MLRYVGMIGLLVFLGVAVFAPVISPHDPHSYHGPALSEPNIEFLLGTNDLGQDILSQIIYGTRTSLLIGTVVAIISTLLSVGIGLLSGYNRRLDPYLLGLCNMILTIPNLLIVIIVVAFSGSDLWNVILVLSFLSWPAYARMIRSQVLSLQEREYVKAAKTFGARQGYLLYKHILPGIYPLMRVTFLTTARAAIVTEASLSFLGLGDVTEISWGSMLHYAFQADSIFISSAWQWWVLPPTLCMILLTLCFSFLVYQGDEKLALPRKKKKRQLTPEPMGHENKNALLQIDHLQVKFPISKREAGSIYVLEDVSLTINKGEVLALIGESGSGKTTMARAIVGMLPTAEIKGSILFQGKNMMDLGSKEASKHRWVDISLVFQNAKESLNPVLKVGEQIEEVLTYHQGMHRREARGQTRRLLEAVELDEAVADCYPHELSGGMCTRVVIAMALACEPALLIADEPTSSLDAITRKKIMNLLRKKVEQYDLTLLLISHDIGVVADVADMVAVIKDGKIVEKASVGSIFTVPEHSYTKKLVESRHYL